MYAICGSKQQLAMPRFGQPSKFDLKNEKTAIVAKDKWCYDQFQSRYETRSTAIKLRII